MEISTYWDDMAEEFRAVVVDYEDGSPMGTGDTMADALFELVQELKPTDKARAFAIDAYRDEVRWNQRAQIYNFLMSIGTGHDAASAKATYAADRFDDGFQYAVELLA